MATERRCPVARLDASKTLCMTLFNEFVTISMQFLAHARNDHTWEEVLHISMKAAFPTGGLYFDPIN